MSSFSDPPPSPPSNTIVNSQPQYNGINGNAANVFYDTSPPPPPPQSPSSSIIIFIIVISSAIIVSASIYILLRYLSRRHQQSFQSFGDPLEESLSRDGHNGNHHNNNHRRSVFDSLPIFTFGSVTGNLTAAGDCAVCLSKFEVHDQLRLLPLCCHAFHAHCIDTWLSSNMTCPLCRSSVNTTDSPELSKIRLEENSRNNTNGGNGSENGNGGGSFRIEIGSISRRRGGTDSGRRSYSIGSFEYIVDDGYEVSVDSTHRRHHSGVSIDKESSVDIPTAAAEAAPPGESLAREVSGGRSWLRDYIGSFSFRSSGRFSGRQSEVVVPVEELEEHRMCEEISELFRWLSGV